MTIILTCKKGNEIKGQKIVLEGLCEAGHIIDSYINDS